MARFTIIDSKGNRHGGGLVYSVGQMRQLYKKGLAASAQGHVFLQVWEISQNGDLLRYDAQRTRSLTDKIMAARSKQ